MHDLFIEDFEEELNEMPSATPQIAEMKKFSTPIQKNKADFEISFYRKL